MGKVQDLTGWRNLVIWWKCSTACQRLHSCTLNSSRDRYTWHLFTINFTSRKNSTVCISKSLRVKYVYNFDIYKEKKRLIDAQIWWRKYDKILPVESRCRCTYVYNLFSMLKFFYLKMLEQSHNQLQRKDCCLDPDSNKTFF